MLDSSRVLDDDKRKNKALKRKLPVQAPPVAQIQVPSDSTREDTPKMAKMSNKKDVVGRKSAQTGLDSVPMQPRTDDGYRTLRRDYLLLEEDSIQLKRELERTQRDVWDLKKQKEALLDELVVLEGLVDASCIVPGLNV